jgi:hypothetical protein
MRATVHDLRASDTFKALGICESDLPKVLSWINRATRRLLFAPQSGEEGWWGTYAKVVFNVDPAAPFITTPRQIARLSALDLCRHPIRVQNQWFEFLDFGVGLQKQFTTGCASVASACGPIQAFDRGLVPTTNDLSAGSQLRITWTDNGDNLKQLFFSGLDINGMAIAALDNGVQINATPLTIDSSQPFVQSTIKFNRLDNIAKDVTLGFVNVYAIDPNGVQTLLQTLDPNQTTAAYRRYFIQNIPNRCHDCDSSAGTVQVTAIAKLDYIPVTCDPDFLIIGNMEALEEEMLAIRLNRMDDPAAKKESRQHHLNAIGYLNGELIHVEGKKRPALNYRPFGNATLERAGLQMI